MNIVKTTVRILMGGIMIFAAIGHFTTQRQEFQAQVPDWIPLSKDLVVLLSGLVEILLGLGMIFLTNKKAQVGALLALFFLLIFPGNINQYVNEINAFGLDTDQKRLNRLFFQPVLIFLALWSTSAFAYIKTLFKKS